MSEIAHNGYSPCARHCSKPFNVSTYLIPPQPYETGSIPTSKMKKLKQVRNCPRSHK